MPQKLSAQAILDFNEKRLHWASVVRDIEHNNVRKWGFVWSYLYLPDLNMEKILKKTCDEFE